MGGPREIGALSNCSDLQGDSSLSNSKFCKVTQMINGIFLNLPIKNLKRSVEFFTGLGFTFNAQFTGDENTCMIIGENMYAMLCEEARFQKFLEKPIADPSTTEVLISLSCESKEEVKSLAEKAFALGAR